MKKNYQKPTLQVFGAEPCTVIAASGFSIPLSQMTIPTFGNGGVIETNDIAETN